MAGVKGQLSTNQTSFKLGNHMGSRRRIVKQTSALRIMQEAVAMAINQVERQSLEKQLATNPKAQAMLDEFTDLSPEEALTHLFAGIVRDAANGSPTAQKLVMDRLFPKSRTGFIDLKKLVTLPTQQAMSELKAMAMTGKITLDQAHAAAMILQSEMDIRTMALSLEVAEAAKRALDDEESED